VWALQVVTKAVYVLGADPNQPGGEGAKAQVLQLLPYSRDSGCHPALKKGATEQGEPRE